MVQNENLTDDKKVVLLDLSMFLLNLLSPQKIKENFSLRNIILEVPSALVTMMWSAIADTEIESDGGHRILFDFIYAHLLGVKNNPVHQNSQDQRILDVVYADHEKLHSLASTAYQKLFLEFAPLIEGATKKYAYSQEDEERLYSQFPIRRYEPAVFLSSAEEYFLQDAYKNNFGLRPHPLYDLYFLQIYHAQTIGLAASPILKRQLIALGKQTYYSLKEWKKTSDIKWDEKEYSADELVQVEEFLAAFSEWEPFILGVLVDITISSIVPGGNFVITAIASGLTSKKIEDKDKKSKGPIIRAAIIGLMVFLITWWGCRPSIIALLRFLGTPKVSSPTPTSYLATIPALTPTIFSSPTSTLLTYTPTVTATFLSTISPISTTAISSNPGYCFYVTQPGDTAQGISSWFSISENDFRNDNNLLPGTEYVQRVMVNVRTSCCNSRYPGGHTYTVRPGDTVFSIAQWRRIAPEYLASANNLKEPWYIQSGQMLCLP